LWLEPYREHNTHIQMKIPGKLHCRHVHKGQKAAVQLLHKTYMDYIKSMQLLLQNLILEHLKVAIDERVWHTMNDFLAEAVLYY